MLSLVGKLDDRVLGKRVRAGTGSARGVKSCFRQGIWIKCFCAAGMRKVSSKWKICILGDYGFENGR